MLPSLAGGMKASVPLARWKYIVFYLDVGKTNKFSLEFYVECDLYVKRASFTREAIAVN